jgi:hypothetical protein
VPNAPKPLVETQVLGSPPLARSPKGMRSETSRLRHHDCGEAEVPMQIDSALREAKTLGSQLAAPSLAIHVRVSRSSSRVSNSLYATGSLWLSA